MNGRTSGRHCGLGWLLGCGLPRFRGHGSDRNDGRGSCSLLSNRSLDPGLQSLDHDSPQPLVPAHLDLGCRGRSLTLVRRAPLARWDAAWGSCWARWSCWSLSRRDAAGRARDRGGRERCREKGGRELGEGGRTWPRRRLRLRHHRSGAWTGLLTGARRASRRGASAASLRRTVVRLELRRCRSLGETCGGAVGRNQQQTASYRLTTPLRGGRKGVQGSGVRGGVGCVEGGRGRGEPMRGRLTAARNGDRGWLVCPGGLVFAWGGLVRGRLVGSGGGGGGWGGRLGVG